MKNAILLLFCLNCIIILKISNSSRDNLYVEGKNRNSINAIQDNNNEKLLNLKENIHIEISNKAEALETVHKNDQSSQTNYYSNTINERETYNKKESKNKNQTEEKQFQTISTIREKAQNIFEMFASIFSKLWEEINPKSEIDFPFKTGSNLQKFYYSIFPTLKLITFIIILSAILYLIKSFFSMCLYNKKNLELKSKIGKKEIITNPNADLIKSINDSEDKFIALKGRKKRLPLPINYNELFNSTYRLEVKKEIQPDSTQHNDRNENFTTVDFMFDELNQTKLKNNDTIANTKATQNQKRIKLEINSNEYFTINHNNLIYDKVKADFIAENEKNCLESIKEVNETDKHSIIFNRLMNNNYIQKTAISNFVKNKPSL